MVFKLEVNQLLYDATYDIEIVNTLGQVVYEQAESTRGYDLNLNIDMGNQAAGVYYMALYYQGYLKKITPFVVHPH